MLDRCGILGGDSGPRGDDVRGTLREVWNCSSSKRKGAGKTASLSCDLIKLLEVFRSSRMLGLSERSLDFTSVKSERSLKGPGKLLGSCLGRAQRGTSVARTGFSWLVTAASPW